MKKNADQSKKGEIGGKKTDVGEKGRVCRTLKYLEKNILSRMPKKLITAALLLKPAAFTTQCQVDYVGFEIENRFVVGYGLGYHDHYWNLPYIAQSSDFN